ncbi:Nucleolar protein 13 [Coemansia sp. RSA 485]|nr:Nucleolar protein 13 [Coemansia sp. RSA 485]
MGKKDKEETTVAVVETPAKDEGTSESQTKTAKKDRKKKKDKKDDKDKKDKSSKKEKKDDGNKDVKGKLRKPVVRSPYGVWIGNLPYTVNKDDIRKFFEPCGGAITRVNLPKKDNKISGFAYVDFDTPEPVAVALTYTEKEIGGRPVLIKDVTDFTKTGAPSRIFSTFQGPANTKESAKKGKDKKVSPANKYPPSPTLFVRNLGFGIKKSDLKAVFKEFGELVGVRVATFEDNPDRCKGFAYIDFKYTGDATLALKSPDLKQIGGRRVTIEYASEEATRKGRPWEFDPKYKYANTFGSDKPGIPGNRDNQGYPSKRERDFGGNRNRDGDSDYEMGDTRSDKPSYGHRDSHKRARKLETENMAETKLQGLPVQFEGQKITFGED